MVIAKREVYGEKILKVIEHIDNHLCETLNLKDLAAIGCFSEYHFHRLMRSWLGENVYAYILRRRIEKAAVLLITSDKSIAEIAYQCGFEEHSSLNKAFKKRFNCTPSTFKKETKRAIDYKLTNIKKEKAMKTEFEIKQMTDKKVIFCEATGDYNKSASIAWGKVCGFAGPKGLMNQNTEFIGISLDDPSITQPENLRYQACLSVDREVSVSGEIGQKSIAGGKYAVFIHKGSYANFSQTYAYIFGEWIQEQPFELADKPSFEKYLNSPDSTPENKLLTEIWIPIAN